MDGRVEKGRKSTIFRIFLVPLIAIMLVQSVIAIGTLVVRRTAGALEEYSAGMMGGLVKNQLRRLETLFPDCLDILQNNTTTGVFLILTSGNSLSPGEFDGFFIRDSDPNTNPLNHSDLLLERGSHVPRISPWTPAGLPGSIWTAGLQTTSFSTPGRPVRSTLRPMQKIWAAGPFLSPWSRTRGIR